MPEMDFLITKEGRAHLAIEATLTDTAPAPDRENSFPFGLDILNAAECLKGMEF